MKVLINVFIFEVEWKNKRKFDLVWNALFNLFLGKIEPKQATKLCLEHLSSAKLSKNKFINTSEMMQIPSRVQGNVMCLWRVILIVQ